MPKCSVVNCHMGYNGFTASNEIRWFRIPKSNARRNQWEFRLNRQGFKVTNETRLCSLHFKEDDYVPESQNKDSSGRTRKKRQLGVAFVVRLRCLPLDSTKRQSKKIALLYISKVMNVMDIF